MRRVTLAVLVVVVAAAGVAGGLIYTWALDPVEYIDTLPDSLHVQDKLLYLALVGDLYACEQDLALAEARLAELGLEPDGADVLVTVYRSGPCPQVAIFERRVTMTALHEGVLEAMARVSEDRWAPGIAASLSAAGRALRSSWPPVKRASTERVAVRVSPRAVQGIRFAARGQFRRRHSAKSASGVGADTQLERADLHGRDRPHSGRRTYPGQGAFQRSPEGRG